MRLQFYIIALLILFAFCYSKSVKITLNETDIDPLNSAICEFLYLGPHHEMTTTGSSGSPQKFYWRIYDPVINMPSNSSTIKYNSEGLLQLEARSRLPQDYKVGELFFDCHVRDEQSKVQSTLPCDEYKNPRDSYSFSAKSSYEACAVSVTCPRVEFAGTFFRLDQSLVLKCPDHIFCVVRQVTITPSLFQYTDEREGKEKGPHKGRTFWVQGIVDFAKSVVDLRVESGLVSVNMADLLLEKTLLPTPAVPNAPPLDVACL